MYDFCILEKINADFSEKIDISVNMKNYPVTSLNCN